MSFSGKWDILSLNGKSLFTQRVNRLCIVLFPWFAETADSNALWSVTIWNLIPYK